MNASPSRQAARRRRMLHFYNNRFLYLMLLPAILYIVVFSYVPMGGLVMAFKRFNYNFR